MRVRHGVCLRECDCVQGHTGVLGEGWEPRRRQVWGGGCLSLRCGFLQVPRVGQRPSLWEPREPGKRLGFNPNNKEP